MEPPKHDVYELLRLGARVRREAQMQREQAGQMREQARALAAESRAMRKRFAKPS